MPVSQPATGAAMYELVRAYAAAGHHRTGTEVDRATADWLAAELRGRGLTVAVEQLTFQQWEATSQLTCDGTPVAHLPVFYEWTGAIETSDVHVAGFDPASGGHPEVLREPIAQAEAAGAAAAVLATQHPEGALVAVNRELGAAVSGFPTVLTAGRDLERLQRGQVALAMNASVGPGTTTNVVGTNAVPGRPLVLTTPRNGWFGCAGERGTGIAVLLHLVERFRELPLTVVATGGHELGYFGGHRWVDACELTPQAVVHVGASVAVEDRATPAAPLIPTRLAMTSLPEAAAAPIASALEPAGLTLNPATDRWLGEAEAFCKLGAPLLSFTGAGLDFHTPGDTPERVTSPRALEVVADAIAEATAALWTASAGLDR